MYPVSFREFCSSVVIFASIVYSASVNVTNNYRNLQVAFNSTNNIPRTVGRERIPSSLNEGGDVKLPEPSKVKTAIDNKSNIEEFVLNEKDHNQKSSVLPRKGVDMFLKKNTMNTSVDADINENKTDHESNASLSTVKHNNMTRLSSTQKSHKPLVTSVVSDNHLTIPDLPPIQKEEKPQKSEESIPQGSQSSLQQQTVNYPTVGKLNLSESQASELIDQSASENSSNFKKFMDPLSKAHPNYIVPIVITIFAVPIFGIFGITAIRRGREAWKNRHYKRMDFLIDGMYND